MNINYRLENNDHIKIEPIDEENFKIINVIRDELSNLEKKYITVIMEDKPIKLVVSDYEIYHNNSIADLENKINDGDYINIKRTELKKPLLIDLFKEINYTPKVPDGMTKVEVLLNGEEAEYISPINDGDKVNIVWR